MLTRHFIALNQKNPNSNSGFKENKEDVLKWANGIMNGANGPTTVVLCEAVAILERTVSPVTERPLPPKVEPKEYHDYGLLRSPEESQVDDTAQALPVENKMNGGMDFDAYPYGRSY